MTMPFAHVADTLVIGTPAIRVQDFLRAMVATLVVTGAGISIGNYQQVVHNSSASALPPADHNAAKFLRTRFRRMSTRKG